MDVTGSQGRRPSFAVTAVVALLAVVTLPAIEASAPAGAVPAAPVTQDDAAPPFDTDDVVEAVRHHIAPSRRLTPRSRSATRPTGPTSTQTGSVLPGSSSR